MATTRAPAFLVLPLVSFVSLAVAQAPLFGQCGGTTTCVSTAVCTPIFDGIYSQCLWPPSSTTTTSSASTTTTRTTTSTSTITNAPLPTGTSSAMSLNDLAKAKGKLYFGSATDNPEFSDTPYTSLLFSKMFGQITPGNSMKWGPTNPSNGTYTYTAGDTVLSRATAANQIVRGHNLVWHQQMPGWVVASLGNATLQEVLKEHITNEVTHYKGKVYGWDVVNEPVDDSGNMRADSIYQTVVGTSYIDLAFRTAHLADPSAKLYWNDYNLEYAGKKFDTTLATIKTLLSGGTPIHGVGFEAHMIVGSVPSATDIAKQMNAFVALGLEVAITELDIRMTLPETPALRQQQKVDYQNMVAGCVLVQKCVGVTIWDYTDKYSWVPSTFNGQGAALPWDANFVRKPAFDGIVAALS